VAGGGADRAGGAEAHPASALLPPWRIDDEHVTSWPAAAKSSGRVRAQRGTTRIRTLLPAPVLLGTGRRSSRCPSSPASAAARPGAARRSSGGTREQLRPRLRGGEGPVLDLGRRRRSNATSPRCRRHTTCPRRRGLLGGYGAGG
jgi:hypothetical protein